MSECAIRSKTEQFAQKPSYLLIFGERPEQFAHIAYFWLVTWVAHSRSFVLSDLSESLTVAHLIWEKWANEWRANEQIPNPGGVRLRAD